VSPFAALAQPEAQPPLRWVLFSLIGAAGLLWSRRRWGSAAALLLLAQCLALSFWTLQLRNPVGLDRNPTVQAFWARVAVAHTGGDSRLGYVIGTAESPSLMTWLAAGGVPSAALQGLSLWTPILFVLALAAASGLVQGSRSRRLMTLALAGTSAPLWGFVGDPSALALLHPESVLGSLLALVILLIPFTVFPHWRRPLGLAAMMAGSLFLGWALSAESTGFPWYCGPWLALSLAPVFALLFVPPIRTMAAAIGSPRMRRTAVEAVFLVSVSGGSSWFWWEPPRTVVGFEDASTLNPAFLAPLDWISNGTGKDATIAADPAYAALISAITGRSALLPFGRLPSTLDQPLRRARLLESLRQGRPDAALAERFGVTHFLVGPGERDPPVPGIQDQVPTERPLSLRRVYADAKDFRIFELVPQ
jgi:hypothetical protein